MENNIIDTILNQERVTSTYADNYFDDDYCCNTVTWGEENMTHESQSIENSLTEWISPSDLLIDKVELSPPFTSKITRGKTHEGILSIGNEVLETEHTRFMASLTGMLRENDATWNHILVNDKSLVIKKVQDIFRNIFDQKSKIMNNEIITFYEKTLQDLETHSRFEVQNVLSSLRAKMISTLNTEIPHKLKKERLILDNVLKRHFQEEVNKIVKYYKLLLDNEIMKHNELINYALNDRNEAFQSFCRQIDAERLTSSMYIMSIERKKCKIKKMFLENIQNFQVTEKLTKIKERQEIINTYKKREKKVSDINKEWELKMKKILELFLKFISFSLKLLPEQSNFLLDFQKMVILQFNEMQKQPNVQPNILLDEDSLKNIFEFKLSATQKQECDRKPFVIEGDLSDTTPPRYGSTETLASDVDLPFVRVNRQYIYAKCHGYDDIKKFINSQKCHCTHQPSPIHSDILPSPIVQPPIISTVVESTSSLETVLLDNRSKLNECPARKCGYFTERNQFPFLQYEYLDFSEKNFERVKAILGKPYLKKKAPELIRAKDIACAEIPFAETKEKFRHAQTQYSEQEFKNNKIYCTCLDANKFEGIKSTVRVNDTPSQVLNDALTKRKASIRRLLYQNPNLLKIFTDENFDFQL